MRVATLNRHRLPALVSATLLTAALSRPAYSQSPKPPTDSSATAAFREQYTKYEYLIPMRDGVRLYTAAYVPKDDSTPYPILLTRTPYGCRPYGIDNYPEPSREIKNYLSEKFIFVRQDVRGRNGSEGTYLHVRPINPHKGPKDTDESTDAWDTIDFLVKHVPDNNGKVGTWGISYPGFYTAAGMIDAHPALKCASPQAPVSDWFVGDDFHHNGALYLAAGFGFLYSFEQKLDDPVRDTPKPFDFKTPDGYAFFLGLGPLANADTKYFKGRVPFWSDMMRHDTYDDYWKARALPPHIKNIHPAVLTVGGWYDAEDLYGALAVSRAVATNSPDTPSTLVMGPWYHGAWGGTNAGDHLGNVAFAAKTTDWYRQHVELPFYKHYLKDAPDPKLPKAVVFEDGTNTWRRYDAWPPRESKEATLYLHADNKLSFDAPSAADNAYDEYVSDPNKPVPYTQTVTIGMTREHMTDDQRFAATRPDVLVYETDPLDADLTLAGPLTPDLHVSTTGTDADWVVKLIDAYPTDFPDPDPNPDNVRLGGYEQLIRGDVFRGKFRNSYEHPEPFEPGKITTVHFPVPDVNHTFRRGHRIMVQIQSSWFPLVDRNPQKFCDINTATPEDFRKATQRVYHTPQSPSAIHVRILPTPRPATPTTK